MCCGSLDLTLLTLLSWCHSPAKSWSGTFTVSDTGLSVPRPGPAVPAPSGPESLLYLSQAVLA